MYKDACCTKEPESNGCSCSCASMCSATSADLKAANGKGDEMGDLNDWVGEWKSLLLKEYHERDLTGDFYRIIHNQSSQEVTQIRVIGIMGWTEMKGAVVC